MANTRIIMGGTTSQYVTGPVEVTVATVLPDDRGQRVPKPARDLLGIRVDGWRDILIILAVAIIGGGLLWYAATRWGRRTRMAAPLIKADPLAALTALEALALDRAGEPAPVLIGAAAAVRQVLADVAPETAPMTTDAIASWRAERSLPLARIVALFEAADAAKFARVPVAPERARAAVGEARTLITLLRAEATAA
jgi:hypothetical protein